MTNIACSLVIVNWKSIDFLRDCIKSVKDTVHSYEIIVIDNNSDHEEKLALQQLTGIKLILNEENIGFAAANNQGFREATGRYIFMLNPDTKILGNSIDNMADFMDKHPDVYALGPRLYCSDELNHHPSVIPLESPFNNLIKMIPLSSHFLNLKERLFFNRNKIQRVHCLVGAAILFQRSVFNEIGYLDEQFFIYTEEIDFCKRMATRGLPIYYYPDARIIHYGGGSQAKASVTKYDYLWTSKVKYFDKHFSATNIKINLSLLLILLKLKYSLLNKRELKPIIKILSDKLSTL